MTSMQGTKGLLRIAERSHSLDQLLETVSSTIAREGSLKACSIFLTESGTDRLRLRSNAGDAILSEQTRAAAHDLATQALTKVLPASTVEASRSLLAVPLMARGHPIGAIVVESHVGPSYSAEQVEALFATAARMVGIVESAMLLDAVGRSAHEPAALGAAETRREVSRSEQAFSGTAASPGIGIGTAVFRRSFPRELVDGDRPFRGEQAERDRVRDAFQKTRNDIARIQAAAARELGEEQALIFTSHLMLLNDPMLRDQVISGIASKSTAAAAVDAALGVFESRLREVEDPYLRERVEDLDDLRSRILGHLIVTNLRDRISDQVIVSPRVAPSLVMEMKAQGALALATEVGGTTSHGVLLARSLGIPAVTGLFGLTKHIAAMDTLIVDGTGGKVIVRPTADTLAKYRERAARDRRRRTEFAKYRQRDAQTADGVRVQLQANVALGTELRLAKENGADGIGLYRTEVPFIVREGFPTRDEQVRIYQKAYEAFPQGPIVFRILDLTGDKFLPHGSIGAAPNAFHGYRSIRVLFDYPHVLRDQVQAFVIAAGERPLRILIPMVTSMDELARVRALIASAIGQMPSETLQRAPTVGVMVEVPAAVELAAELAREVDYLSIGTNDLIQYTLVIDRENSRLASVYDAYHPAILRMIQRVIIAAHAVGKPVTVCGEMAARPDLAIALLALGVDALSVAPSAIPELKQALGAVCLKPLASAMGGVLARRSAHEVEHALKKLLRVNASGGVFTMVS